MIISILRRFILITNPKTVSISIEKVLYPYSDINLLWAEFGKHSSLADMQEKFVWLFDVCKIKDLCVCGVTRDTIEFMKSLYIAY